MVGPVVLIFSDKKLGISQGGVETHDPPAPALSCRLHKGTGVAVFLEAKPSPTAPHTLQSDLGEAAMWMGSLQPHPTSGAWSQPGVKPRAPRSSGSSQAGHGIPWRPSPIQERIEPGQVPGYRAHPSWNLTPGPCPEVILDCCC